MAAIESR
jgi:hypothetical protein